MFVQCSALQDNSAIRSVSVTRQAEGQQPLNSGRRLLLLPPGWNHRPSHPHYFLQTCISPLCFGPNSYGWICVRMHTRQDSFDHPPGCPCWMLLVEDILGPRAGAVGAIKEKIPQQWGSGSSKPCLVLREDNKLKTSSLKKKNNS